MSLSRAAEKYFKRCDEPTRDRLRQKFENLKADPFDLQSSKMLKGRNDQRSARVGDLRILFRVTGLDIIVAEMVLAARFTSMGDKRFRRLSHIHTDN